MIQLKGHQAGALRCIVPDDISERQLLEDFASMTEQGGRILAGSRLTMDMQSRVFTPSLVQKIWKGFIEPAEATVDAWIADDPSSLSCLEKIGLKTVGQEHSAVSPQTAHSNRGESIAAKGMLYTGNLRGGQKLTGDGDIIVMGHVNMGAEIYAGGHIIVLGRLHGVVHAGCDGDNDMSLTVRSIESSQVRIGNKVGIIDPSSDFWGKPAVITVRNEEILVTDWPSI